MLNESQFTALGKTLQDELVLSVYVARESSDPGTGPLWRMRLEAATDRLRDALEKEAPEQLEAFDGARGHLAEALAPFGRVYPYRGWSGFATADRLWAGQALPYEPAAVVRWQHGPFVSPVIRAFKAARPATVGVVDQWRARIYLYEDGALSDEDDEMVVLQRMDDVVDQGVTKRAAGVSGAPVPRGASGMRGETRTDAARHALQEETRRLVAQLRDAIMARTGDSGIAVVGGMPETLAALLPELEAVLPGRVGQMGTVTLDAARDEIVAEVERAVSALTLERQARLLESCLEAGDGDGAGWDNVERAVAAGAADTLLVSRALIESSPDAADRVIRTAWAQGAHVEEVGDEIGARLMAEFGGVAARLRFRPVPVNAARPSGEG